MSSVTDLNHKRNHLNHFMVNTRTFQIEQCRNMAMYEHLQSYIRRQNEKKKQELEMSEELKRAKREKELKHRRNMLTLDEVNNEILKQRQKIRELEGEKSKLFDDFKKVLHEEEREKREKAASPKEGQVVSMLSGYAPARAAPSGSLSQSQSHNQAVSTTPSTVAPVTTSKSTTPQTMASSSSNHPVLNVQPMQYFAQPSVTIVGPNTIPFNPHTRNRVPTPTGASSSMASVSKSQSSQPVFSKPMQPSQHQLPGVVLPMTSLSSPVATSSPYQVIPNDRHRSTSYKRTHDQVSSAPMSGPANSAPPHLPPYLANLRQPQMQALPPHAFHNIPMDQYMYHSFLNSMSLPPSSYMNNPK